MEINIDLDYSYYQERIGCFSKNIIDSKFVSKYFHNSTIYDIQFSTYLSFTYKTFKYYS